ncbi:MAG: hypothetical protein E2O53_07095 [Gammaproteobacteria bacterium]|nr:MAG: hypothetical protein E2O53_07095 [Gammaproteobacteria bacterium]
MHRVIITMLLAITLAPPVAARDLAEICKKVGELTVGQWADYHNDVPFVESLNSRYAIVGEETVDDTPHFWLELNIANPVGNTIMQMLIPGYPYPPQGISGLIMQLAPDLVMEYSKEMAGSMSSQGGDNLSAPTAQACNESEIVGTESVTVPAGTFQAVHVKARLGGGKMDIWISDEVPFGIVKFADEDGYGLQLLAHGMDAKSSITGTPMKFGLPPPQ